MLAAEAAARQKTGKSVDGKAGGRGKTLPKELGKLSHAGEAAERAAKLAGTNRQLSGILHFLQPPG